MLYVPPGMRNSGSSQPSGSGPSQTDIDRLNEKYEKLKLVCMAMWTFIKEQGRVDEDALIERVREIDKLDGSVDGKLKVTAKKCHKCGRTINPKFDKCQYCGMKVQITSIFETL